MISADIEELQKLQELSLTKPQNIIDTLWNLARDSYLNTDIHSSDVGAGQRKTPWPQGSGSRYLDEMGEKHYTICRAHAPGESYGTVLITS
jgi:hypothetical protein